MGYYKVINTQALCLTFWFEVLLLVMLGSLWKYRFPDPALGLMNGKVQK